MILEKLVEALLKECEFERSDPTALSGFKSISLDSVRLLAEKQSLERQLKQLKEAIRNGDLIDDVEWCTRPPLEEKTEGAGYTITYFKPSGKYYTEDKNVEWPRDPKHYNGWKPFDDVVRIKGMFAVCMESPLGYPQFCHPQKTEEQL